MFVNVYLIIILYDDNVVICLIIHSSVQLHIVESSANVIRTYEVEKLKFICC